MDSLDLEPTQESPHVGQVCSLPELLILVTDLVQHRYSAVENLPYEPNRSAVCRSNWRSLQSPSHRNCVRFDDQDGSTTMVQLIRSPHPVSNFIAALAVAASLFSVPASARAQDGDAPQIAYVGTFSSPLGDVLPTQVDLPPGNGRGIHIFHVNRATGALAPAGVHEMGTSPSSLVLNASGTRLYSSNETDRVGDDKQGTVSAFATDPTDGTLELLNTVPSGGAKSSTRSW